uniref:NACHT domain-containing protein n=1 Tax=Cyprinus carpio carpio TaxID=630221 RepID=A0A9J8CE63_CYPCA
MYVSSRTHLDGQIVHEMRELERPYNEDIKDENVINYDDLLKPRSSTGGRIRRIMMRGISGCGKTTAVRKFVSDWAHGRTHQHIDFVFPLHLCELNILHDKKLSLIEHLDLLFPKLLKPETLEGSQILFIWDGLGEFRFTLKFKRTKTCTDPVTPVSVGCMLVNLLKGNLLPSAQILVTSRLKDAGLIPPEYIQRVVELHGLDDLQWEELIRSEVRDQNVAARAIVHVKSSRSLYIMRSLPFFCQMASTVLEELFSNCCNTDPPLTLTEMFTHFLLIQMKRHVEKSAKSSTEEILKLGELAWHMLEKNTLTFMEKDQKETNTDPLLPVKLSEDWPMFFRKQHLMGLGKMYRFTHPCVQEFLAALYVAVHYEPSKGNVMSFTLAEKAKMLLSPTDVPPDMHRRAVDRALRSKTGQLDIFLLFLLGICAGPSNKLLSCFFQNTSLRVRTEDVVKNILQKIKAKPLFEISVNLSRCLEELDVALPVVQNRGPVEFQMDEDVHVTPSEWSHIATTLLTSEDSSLTFDVSKYAKVDEAIMRLLPVIKISRVLRLDEATDLSWALIASALRSPANRIREINIEKNALSYINLSVLSVGMSSPNCKVEALRTPYFGYRKDGDHLLSGILLNPTHLRELKLLNSFRKNDRTVESISQILMDPDCRLENLTLVKKFTLLLLVVIIYWNKPLNLVLHFCFICVRKKIIKHGQALLFPSENVEILLLLFFYLSILCFVFPSLQGIETLESCKILAAALCSSSCRLQELDLRRCYWSSEDQALQLLSEAFRHPNFKVTVLRLEIKHETASALFSAFQENPSHLRKLELSLFLRLTLGLQQLFSLLADPCFKLETLRIAHPCYDK